MNALHNNFTMFCIEQSKVILQHYLSSIEH